MRKAFRRYLATSVRGVTSCAGSLLACCEDVDMTTFYLQQHEKGGRWIIDSTFPQNCHRVQDSRDAVEWLEAKRLFGFELTPVQEWLLDLHNEQRRKAMREAA